MIRSQTESIREFILDRVAENPRHVAREVAQAYGISRQAANRHLDTLVEAGFLEERGYTRSREYTLRRTSLLNREVRVTPVLSPDRIWEDHIAPVLAHDRAPVRELCHGAFAELIRNVIAHAGASWITVSFTTTARHIDLTVADNGRGIFKRLMERGGFTSPRDAAATMARHANARSSDDPASRLALLGTHFDSFTIASSRLVLSYDGAARAWSLREADPPVEGTRTTMHLRRTGKHRRPTARESLAEAFGR